LGFSKWKIKSQWFDNTSKLTFVQQSLVEIMGNHNILRVLKRSFSPHVVYQNPQSNENMPPFVLFQEHVHVMGSAMSVPAAEFTESQKLKCKKNAPLNVDCGHDIAIVYNLV
jgi:hypothetical protein